VRTGVLEVRKFVLQPLTVLFSYDFEASVPLWDTPSKEKMVALQRERNQPEGDIAMASVYASWVGQAVVLQVATGDLRVPLRGVIVGESEGTVRFRIGEGWDIDIYKPMILAVEQDNWASIMMN
jgi:hypothetical protein